MLRGLAAIALLLGLAGFTPPPLHGHVVDTTHALSDADRTVMTAYGAFGEKKQYGKTVQGVIRSTFVVGADGRIEQAWRNVKATGHVARVLKELGLAS